MTRSGATREDQGRRHASVVARSHWATCLFCAVLLTFGSVGLLARETAESVHILPGVFTSRRAASQFVAHGIEGGSVRIMRFGRRDLLVVSMYGAGFTDVAIAIYRPFADGWKVQLEWKPPSREPHRVLVEDEGLVALGELSGRRTILLRSDGEEPVR